MSDTRDYTGSGFLRGTTSPAKIWIFAARSGPKRNETIADTWNHKLGHNNMITTRSYLSKTKSRMVGGGK